MGRYIDWQDVVDRYRSVSDRDATEIGSSFIPYAEAEVDGRLASKYTAPFSNNNMTVKDLCIDLVYIKVGNLNIEETEKLQTMVDAKFERLINGDEIMFTSSGDQISQSVAGTVWSNTKDYHPVFGLSEQCHLAIDSSQLADEEAARQ